MNNYLHTHTRLTLTANVTYLNFAIGDDEPMYTSGTFIAKWRCITFHGSTHWLSGFNLVGVTYSYYYSYFENYMEYDPDISCKLLKGVQQ